MIPGSLSEWSVDALVSLLAKSVYENDLFDFKESLPDRRDEKGKDRLADACAAFANSSGGYLVFGVADDRSIDPTNRLVGVSPTLDFPERFGVFPQRCSPTVAWEFRNPPLRLDNGKLIHVVYVPPSPLAPHSTSSGASLRFPKRTSKGTEFMDHSEVQTLFAGYYEKRLKLQLLRAELAQIAADAGAMIIPEERNDGTSYALPTIELRVLESVLSDTYSITHKSFGFLETMNALRSLARMTTNKVEVFRLEVALPMSDKTEIVKAHNDFIRPQCVRIIHLVQQAIQQLDALLEAA